MQAFQLCMPLIIVHPLPRETTLLALCTPRFHGKYKGKSFFWHKKVPLNYAPSDRRSDVPSIMQVQTYLGGGLYLSGLSQPASTNAMAPAVFLAMALTSLTQSWQCVFCCVCTQTRLVSSSVMDRFFCLPFFAKAFFHSKKSFQFCISPPCSLFYASKYVAKLCCQNN